MLTVLEFTSMIGYGELKDTSDNSGGYPSTYVYDDINNQVYNYFPAILKEVIIPTKVVSSHGYNDYGPGPDGNYVTNDMLYLLSASEVFANDGRFDIVDDTSSPYTRQLDYYSNNATTDSNGSAAVKELYDGFPFHWWLRSAYNQNSLEFYAVYSSGGWTTNYGITGVGGISPAFRVK